MNVFDAWLVIVGLAIGAGLAWLVMLDLRRRDDDVSARESRAEAAWIADTLRSRDIAADAEAVEEVLRLHRTYLAGIPDDGASRPEPWAASSAAPSAAFEATADYEADVAPEPASPRPTPAAAAPDEPKASGKALEPAWGDADMEAAHEALDALLRKHPPED